MNVIRVVFRRAPLTRSPPRDTRTQMHPSATGQRSASRVEHETGHETRERTRETPCVVTGVGGPLVSLALSGQYRSARSTHHGATHTPSFDGEETRRRSYARFVCVCGTKRSPARTSAVRTCMRGKYGTWALAAPTASASAPTGQVPAARRRRRPGSPPSGSSASAPTEQVPASRRRRRPGSPPSGARRGRRPWRPGRMSATSAARAPRGAAARRAPWPRGSLCGVSCNATRTIKGEYASCQRVGRPSSPRGIMPILYGDAK